MNLIEQLGGYENAKRELELKEQDSVLQCCASVTANMIRSAMLEYRRQHNIYDVGDYYVYLYGWDSDLDIVCKFNPSEWGDHLWNIKNMIRHATDAEIKAGKRL